MRHASRIVPLLLTLAVAERAQAATEVQASCDGRPGAGNDCNGESCCTRLPVPAGLLGGKAQARAGGAPKQRAVAAFALDKYEVTVGRFRSWVEAGQPTPAPGERVWRGDDGAELHWDGSWRVQRGDRLRGWARYDTWTGGDDRRPKNNVDWFTALAFCRFDGGRLPTSLEWHYAAAGGDEQRKYPWGASEPTSAHAAFNCLGDGDPSCSLADILPVGAHPLGAGRWGHHDLAGSMFEWTLAWSLAGEEPEASSSGGGFCYIGGVDRRATTFLLPETAVRRDTPGERSHMVGVRCAYDS